jgi:hypothetical protein
MSYTVVNGWWYSKRDKRAKWQKVIPTKMWISSKL